MIHDENGAGFCKKRRESESLKLAQLFKNAVKNDEVEESDDDGDKRQIKLLRKKMGWVRIREYMSELKNRMSSDGRPRRKHVHGD